jgi:hypothetical protein
MRSPLAIARDRVRRAAQPFVLRRLLKDRFASTTFVWSEPTSGTIDVLLCLWNRPELLQPMLESLDRQTGTEGIRIRIWNNQRRDDDRYRSILAGFRPEGALAAADYVTSPFNLGAMARFYWARRIARERGSVPVIVVDDDEVLPSDFVRVALEAYDPAAVSAFWAFVITGEGYWEREFAVPGGTVDHIGPGGIVLDAALFLDDRFFTDLPRNYWFLDDIWLTWFAKRAGLDLRKLDVHIDFVMDEFNQINQIQGQALAKAEFYARLYGKPA